MVKVEDLNLKTFSSAEEQIRHLDGSDAERLYATNLVLVLRHFVTSVNQGGRTDKAQKC